MFSEFKNFILKGDVVALSTGVIIGGAFGKIVDAIVNGLINPLIATAIGKPSFELKVGAFDIGLVITAAFMFLVTAAVIFFVIVRPANALMAKVKNEAPPAAPPADVTLLTEIRDLLKK